MKQLSTTILCLMATTTFAMTAPLHLPKGAKVSPTPLTSTQPMKAQMGCNVYSIHGLDDETAEVKLLLSHKGQVIDVGTATFYNLALPAPYNKIAVAFNHFYISFLETGLDNFTPFLQAFLFSKDKVLDGKEVDFTIENARSGSNILLRGGYQYDSETEIYYQCAITFLK